MGITWSLCYEFKVEKLTLTHDSSYYGCKYSKLVDNFQ